MIAPELDPWATNRIRYWKNINEKDVEFIVDGYVDEETVEILGVWRRGSYEWVNTDPDDLTEEDQHKITLTLINLYDIESQQELPYLI
jgi:hypothetical protein